MKIGQIVGILGLFAAAGSILWLGVRNIKLVYGFTIPLIPADRLVSPNGTIPTFTITEFVTVTDIPGFASSPVPVTVTVISTETVTSAAAVVTMPLSCQLVPTVNTWTAISSRPSLIYHGCTGAEIGFETLSFTGIVTDSVCAASTPATSSFVSSNSAFTTMYVPNSTTTRH